MPEIIDLLVTELERPRELPAQVVHHLGNNYAVERDLVGEFLVTELSRLEDYEIDLILSPVFTPAITDQAVFADHLGRESIPPDLWPLLVEQLVARPTCATLIAGNGLAHAVPLHAVTVERYVHRLRLAGTIPAPLFEIIASRVPAPDRPVVKAVARRAAWEAEGRCEILLRYLAGAAGSDRYRIGDVVELLNVAETYQPADLVELLARLPHWLEVLRQEIQGAANPKPFFNERVQDLHGGGRDRRRPDEIRRAAREQELAALQRLRVVLDGSDTRPAGRGKI